MFCNALPCHCRDAMRLLMHKVLSECSHNLDCQCTNEPCNGFATVLDMVLTKSKSIIYYR